MGQKFKQNHWVPQAYLRAFAADPERLKIWRFSKEAGEPERKPINKVAVRHHLYTARNSDGTRDYSLEQKFSKLEQLFANKLWSALCTDMVDLQWEPLRKMVSLLAATMYLRNPAQLERSKALHRNLAEALTRLPNLPDAYIDGDRSYELDEASWQAFRDADEQDMKEAWIADIGQGRWLAELFIRMRWSVLVSERPAFITSDHPVCALHRSLEFRGLEDPETFVVFPISPTRVLTMDHRHREPAGQYYLVRPGPEATNLLLFRYANEYLFSHRHPDEVMAELLIVEEQGAFR